MAWDGYIGPERVQSLYDRYAKMAEGSWRKEERAEPPALRLFQMAAEDWNSDGDLRGAFGGYFDAYCAYRRQEQIGRVRAYTKHGRTWSKDAKASVAVASYLPPATASQVAAEWEASPELRKRFENSLQAYARWREGLAR